MVILYIILFVIIFIYIWMLWWFTCYSLLFIYRLFQPNNGKKWFVTPFSTQLNNEMDNFSILFSYSTKQWNKRISHSYFYFHSTKKVLATKWIFTIKKSTHAYSFLAQPHSSVQCKHIIWLRFNKHTVGDIYIFCTSLII